MNREVAAAINRLADAVLDYNRRQGRREARERDRERKRRLAEGPAPDRVAGVPYDSLGRRLPARLTAVSFTRAIPGYIEKFDKRVPDGRLERNGDAVIVDCPCGTRHRIEPLVPMQGECGRHFIFDGKGVRVAAPEGNDPAPA